MNHISFCAFQMYDLPLQYVKIILLLKPSEFMRPTIIIIILYEECQYDNVRTNNNNSEESIRFKDFVRGTGPYISAHSKRMDYMQLPSSYTCHNVMIFRTLICAVHTANM